MPTKNTETKAEPNNRYAERISFALDYAGYNKRVEYARLRDLSGPTVTGWCRPNGAAPSLDSMAKLSGDTGITLEWLINGTGPRIQEAANTPMDTPLLIDAFKMILEQGEVLGHKNNPLTVLEMAIPLYHYGLDTHHLDPKMAKTLIETRRMTA